LFARRDGASSSGRDTALGSAKRRAAKVSFILISAKYGSWYQQASLVSVLGWIGLSMWLVMYMSASVHWQSTLWTDILYVWLGGATGSLKNINDIPMWGPKPLLWPKWSGSVLGSLFVAPILAEI
jgi:hypothetical protein